MNRLQEQDETQESDETEVPECMYCGASLKKRGNVRGFSVVCPECKAML